MLEDDREYAPDAPPPPSGNGMGVAGFVVSLVGLVATCGLLCPLGLVFSLIGLKRTPKGLAIAGTVIGGIGSLLLALVATSLALNWEVFRTTIEFGMADVTITAHRDQHGEYPDDDEGAKIVEDVRDGWDRPVRYQRTKSGYELRSAGPDGAFDTGDDLRHEG